MENFIKKIKNNILFKDMTEDDIKTIFSCCNAVVQSYEDNQLVFEKDSIVKNLGIVIDGELNLIAQKYNGTRVIITTLLLNDFFGEALIFSSEKRAPYDLVSVGNSMVIFIPYSFFFQTCTEACEFHSKLINNMLTILSDKITMLNNKMQILNAETIKGKISVYLLSIYKKINKMVFDIPMKRQEMAEFLNVTRPSLSRELSNMQSDNIIEIYRSTVKILDLERLYELSD